MDLHLRGHSLVGGQTREQRGSSAARTPRDGMQEAGSHRRTRWRSFPRQGDP